MAVLGSFLSILPVVARRVVANGRLLAAVVVGAVLAAALMSTTAIYPDAIRDLGLSFALRDRGPIENDLLIRATSHPSPQEQYTRSRDFIDSSVSQALGALVRGHTWTGRSSTFFPTSPGAAVPQDEGRPRSHLQFVTDLQDHVRVVEGRMPEAVPAGSGTPRIEAALSATVAGQASVRVGDRLDLHPFWRPDAVPVQVEVVGLIEPNDLSEEYWLGQTDFFELPAGRWTTLPLFVPEETFFAVTAYLPTMTSDFSSFIYVDTGRIDASNADNVRTSIDSLERRLSSNVERSSIATDLPEVLGSFKEKLFFTRIPLLVLVLQVSGIVLYYLFMVSTMLVERQSGEIALLKSRGATTAQVMQIYAVEGAMIVIAALVVGPPLAAGVVSLLGKTPPFHDLSGGSYLEVHLSAAAYGWALSGAVLALAALLWPAYQATRRTVVQYKSASSRPPKESPFTRYYLDLAFVGAAGILFLQLNRRGSLVTEKLFGEQTADPILLLTPAFFILTVGIFFLRLFPLVLRIVAWAVARAQGAAIIVGMWQLVRNPVHYSRLVLLLMLATAVGMFAASFGSTLDRSYEDRAQYEAGAPLRVTQTRKVEAPGPAAVPGVFTDRFGVEAVSSVLRLDGSLGGQFDRTNAQILAIEPGTFDRVAYFRGDFSDRSFESLLSSLGEEGESQPGVPLPEDARWLGLWVNPTELRGRVAFEARVIDANGRYLTYTLGTDGGEEYLPGWSFVVADLTRPVTTLAAYFENAPPKAPLVLQAVSVRFISRASVFTGAYQVDDLQTSAASALPGPLATTRVVNDATRSFAGLPSARVVTDFENIDAWETLQGIVQDPLPDRLRQVASPAGGRAMEVSWTPVAGQPSTHGFRVRGESGPVAVLASESFVRKSGVGTGKTARLYVNSAYVDIEVKGTFSWFPTLGDTNEKPALVANVSRLEAAINAVPRSQPAYRDEFWLLPGPETRARVDQALTEGRLAAKVVSYDDIRSAQQRDPLVAAGWQGILFISFAAILLLSAIGFLIYSYLTAQKRTLEFAVLRTMGFSRGQIAAVVGFEQVFVIGLGMVAGTLLGMRLGRLMVRYTDVTETGSDVIPPMLLHVNWTTVASAWAILAAAFLVTIAVVVLLYSRLALYRVLRIGEG